MLVKRLLAISGFLCIAGLLTAASGQDAGGGGGAGGDATQRYFNIRTGPVYVTLTAQTTTEFVDNVNLSSGIDTPIKQDLIFSPSFGINAISELQLHPLSETNTTTMGLSMNFGYREHILQPALNQKIFDINISPDSEFSFLVRIGHFKIRLHDGFALQSDPVTDGALSNVAVFRRFTNAAGVNVEWDVNSDTLVNLAYTHTNVYALDLVTLGNSGTSSNLSTSNITNSTDALSLMASTKIIPELTVGWGANVAATSFPGAPQQDSTTYSYGPFASLHLSQFTTLNASCGISKSEPGNVFTGSNTANNNGSNSTSNYANVSLTNQLNTYYTQTLSAGREIALDLVGTQTSDNYLRYSSVWKMNAHISLNFNAFAEDISNAGTPNNNLLSLQSNVQSDYRRYGGGVGTSLRLSKKLTTSLNYRYVQKVTGDPLLCYKQNDIIWTVSYSF